MQGVIQIKKTDMNPLFVFIKPPSMEELERRLRGRKTETEESLQRRLAAAAAEIAYGETPGNFDLIIVNDDVEAAGERMKRFIMPYARQLENWSTMTRDTSTHSKKKRKRTPRIRSYLWTLQITSSVYDASQHKNL